MDIEFIRSTEWIAGASFALSAFLVCLVSFPLTIRLSRTIGLVDNPSARKQHSESTPLVGGITVYLVFLAISAILAREWINVSMLAWIGLVMAIGAFDDMVDLSAINRLGLHAIIIVGIFATDGLVVYSIGDILGTGPLFFATPLAIVLTIIAVLGAVNSVNMIDGIDGLLGCLAVVSLFTLMMIGITADEDGFVHKSFTTADIATMLGALCAFLLFNSRFFHRKQAAVFLGDAGSTAIGFCIVYLLIDFSQGSNPLISPVTAGWILGLPLLDASAVIGKRLLSGQSPIKPGRDHIHHILLDSGFSVNQTVGALVFLHCLLVFIGVSAKLLAGPYTDIFLFWFFLSLVFLRILLTSSISLCLMSGTKK